MAEKIELIRASVRPRLLIIATILYAVFGFISLVPEAAGNAGFEGVRETFKWMTIGGWGWYFGERAWTHFKEITKN